jgi:Transglycosylase SLT domain
MSGSAGQTAVDVVNAARGAQQFQATGAMQDAANTPAPQQAAPLPPVTTQPDPQATNVTNTTDQGPQFDKGKASPAEPNQPAVATSDQSTLDQNLGQLSKGSQAAPTGPVKEVAQSETTPDEDKQAPNSGRPVVDPRPLAMLAKADPDRYNEVLQVAHGEGISPARLAAHWYNESGFAYNAPHKENDGYGPMQVLPSTAQGNNDHGNLDINNPHDNLKIGAKVIRGLDDKYGRDSVSSVMAYQGGTGSVDDIAKNPDAAERNHPTTMAYARKMFPGYDIGGSSATPGGNVDPKQAVQSGVQGGPDGFMKYIVQASPGMPMTDAWQHAEGSLVKAFLMKGDLEGAQHARDFVLQMSHQGSNMHLMAAHQAMMAGDTAGAAQHLAAAHAFFPDGTMGRFGIDKQGQLWAQRMDEHDPSKQIGQSFRVTPEGIAGMLNQTQDPNQYMKMVQTERLNAAEVRQKEKMGDYYGDLILSREKIAAGHNATSTTNAEIRGDAVTSAAQIRADARTNGTGPGGSIATAANKESTALYGPDAMPNETPSNRAQLSETYVGARQMGATPQTAEYIAGGLKAGTLKLLKGQTDEYGVTDGKRVVGYLPEESVRRTFGIGGDQSQQGAPTAQMGKPGSGTGNTGPIGASANSGMAVGTGMTQNLSGVVQPEQSSAVPTKAGA